VVPNISMDWFKGKTDRKTLCLLGKSMVSSFDFPLNQSIEIFVNLLPNHCFWGVFDMEMGLFLLCLCQIALEAMAHLVQLFIDLPSGKLT